MLAALDLLVQRHQRQLDIIDYHRVPLGPAYRCRLFLPFASFRKGADVAGAHLAAGRVADGAIRRLGAGVDHAEDGAYGFLRPTCSIAPDASQSSGSAGCLCRSLPRITSALVALAYRT